MYTVTVYGLKKSLKIAITFNTIINVKKLNSLNMVLEAKSHV